MNLKQRILFTARHAFLKHGYHAVTIKKIADLSGATPGMIRYYYGSKGNLFNIIFLEFVQSLIKYLHGNKNMDIEKDFEKRTINYPEIFEVAWFVADEFHTNSGRVVKLIKENPEMKARLTSIYSDAELKKNFDILISINVGVIMQRNILRL